MKKEEIIAKIRTSSLIIGIVCTVAAAVQGVFVLPTQMQYAQTASGGEAKAILIGTIFSGAVDVVILLLAAVMFFWMSRSGRPFTPKKIWIVLLIAALMFLKAIVPSLLLTGSAGSLVKGYAYFLTRASLIEGLLFLFVALTMYYASMLQQKSDETL